MDEMKSFPKENEDLKNQILKILSFWKFIVLSLVVALLLVSIYIKLTLPIYDVHTTVLIKKENSELSKFSNPVYDATNNELSIENEIGILKSMQLTERAINRLNFGVSYFIYKKLNYYEIYNACPFRIIIDSTHNQIANVPIKVEILSKKRFRISADCTNAPLYNTKTNTSAGNLSQLEFSIDGNVNSTIETGYLKFKFEPVTDDILDNYQGKKFYFVINSRERILNEFQNFSVTNLKSSSIIAISVLGNNVDKMADFLNALTEVYLEKTVEKKLLISNNTIKFIESQLGGISDSLRFSAEQLQNFQSQNKIINIDFNAQRIMQNLEDLQKQKADLILQSKYFEYIKNFIIKNQGIDEFVSPGAIGINDQVFNGLLAELLQSQTERNELVMNVKKENPFLKSIDLRIENKKKLILENVKTLIEANDISLKELNDRIASCSEKASAFPKTNGQLVGYERVFKLNDDLYTYLLTKRSETQISKAALVPDNEVLDRASRRSSMLVTPKKGKMFLIAFLLGLVIPVVIIQVFYFFNDKINSIKDVENLTDIPILGCVVHDRNNDIKNLNTTNSIIAESLRSIRTNFQFILPQNGKHTILITSSFTDEGKSFVSSSLASSFALFGKKAILLCFDLRKPFRHEKFDNSSLNGLSSFLSGNTELNDIIKHTEHSNLDIIFPGALPPNPNELIASSRTEELFNELRKDYDYIIVDTPPVGLIADALLLYKYVDLNIFIVRHKRTSRELLTHICNMYKKKNINNLAIIVNDIPLAKTNYGYGYNYYSYGYGYNYYNSSSKKRNGIIKSFKKLLS